MRQTYSHDDAELAAAWVDQLSADLQDLSCPPEIRQLGRTLRRWRDQIVAWHTARVTNAPTESMIIWSLGAGVVDVADEVA